MQYTLVEADPLALTGTNHLCTIVIGQSLLHFLNFFHYASTLPSSQSLCVGVP
jgi:hypothetical protein